MALNPKRLVHSAISAVAPDVAASLPNIPTPKRKRENRLVAFWRNMWPRAIERDTSPRRAPFWSSLFGRRLSPAEKEEIEQQLQAAKRARDMHWKLTQEASNYSVQISKALANQGICFKPRDSEHARRIRMVEFCRPYKINEYQIMLRLDTRNGHLPPGVKIDDIDNPAILRTLTAAVRHMVRFKSNDAIGEHWIVIDRELGIGGVPVHVGFDEMLKTRPAQHENNPFVVPLGKGENGRAVWRDMAEDLINLLILGSPRMGKSNLANVILCALLQQTTPRQLQLVMIDLKGGMELSFFENAPHLAIVPRLKVKLRRAQKVVDEDSGEDETEEDVNDRVIVVGGEDETHSAFITRREDVPGVLKWCLTEIEHRMNLCAAQGVKKLSEYNRKINNAPLPRILVVIDEWASVKLEPRMGALCESLLIDLTNRGPALGLHVILSTQTPEKSVITSRTRNAFWSRIAFGMSDQYMSQMIVGSYDATTKLERSGHGIFVLGKHRAQFQAPYMPNSLVTEIVNKVIEREKNQTPPAQALKANHDVTDEEIFKWALDDNGGYLSEKKIYEKFKQRGISNAYCKKWTREMEGKIIFIGDVEYEILQPVKTVFPPLARRLMAKKSIVHSGDSTNAIALLPSPADLIANGVPIGEDIPQSFECTFCEKGQLDMEDKRKIFTLDRGALWIIAWVQKKYGFKSESETIEWMCKQLVLGLRLPVPPPPPDWSPSRKYERQQTPQPAPQPQPEMVNA
jgi:hypothetical protein